MTRMKFCIILLMSFAVSAPGAEKKSPAALDKINYSVGYQIGGDFKRQNIQLNAQALVRGIEDALKNTPAMSTEEMRTTLIELKKRIVTEQKKQQQDKNRLLKENGERFLAKNTKDKSVVTLASGLQYKVLKAGHGKSPGKDDTVTVHYRGTLVDGREFDSSYRHKKPVSFTVSGVIEGWRQALTKMKEGAKWKIFIPHELGYRDRGGPLAYQTLIFEVELIAVKPKNS